VRLANLAPLLSYPGPDYQARVRECLADVPSPELAEFALNIEGLAFEALQELYARTFDWNPDTTLDLGWHLFGENYDRGDFLVKLRGALRTHGLPESTELPDHLSHILPLLECMPAPEQATFIAQFVLPGLRKLCAGLAKAESAYLPLLISIQNRMSAIVPEPVNAGAMQ
jgi:nitrate reductase delta subunit